ncbi:MAG: transglycosylase domain-containing protein [Glaciihabitans sp.]
MARQETSAAQTLGAVVGGLGLSVLAGILVAVLITPLATVTNGVVTSTTGIFDSLPSNIDINRQPGQNKIFALRDGQPVQIATIFDQNREEVTWDQVSEFAKNAAVSGEDRRFYEHGGIDLQGIARAAVTNASSGGVEEGASTITQQYVKNTFIQESLTLPTEEEREEAYQEAIAPSVERKVKEMKLAISLEKKYTKQEILLAYLNIANFGGNTYGIQAAAKRYYNTTALNHTLAQAASLIAIVQSPGVLELDNPENFAANKERRDVILGFMLGDGNITAEQHAEAVATPVDPTTVVITEASNGCLVANDHTRFFCDYVTNLIKDLPSLGADPTERATNWKRGGYELYTTLDLGLQTVAQDAVWANAPDNATALNLGAAAVSIEVGTGRILTMSQNKKYDNTGTADPTKTAVNFSTDRNYGGSSGFQPGSTYKVFTLLNWLQNDHGLNEVVNGSPRTVQKSAFSASCSDPGYGPYPFKNDDGTAGPMTVTNATAKSVNGAFISMALELDLCGIRDTAASIGVHRADGTELQTNPSSVLGTNEIAPMTMSAAYAAIAGNGVYCTPIAIDRIVAADGTQLPGQSANCTQALDPAVASTAAFAMSKVMVSGGTATQSNPYDGVPYIGKTGTTDSSNQTWVVGASTKVATAVWVGNIVGQYPMRRYKAPTGIAGGGIRHAIFRTIATAVDKVPNLRGVAFPPASSRLLRGSGITVPNVSGLTVAAATSTLETQGFKVTQGAPVAGAAAPGTVASTEPAAGTSTYSGGSITLRISDGSLGSVPNEVGNGDVPFYAAVDHLKSFGFTNVNADGCAVAPDRIDMVVSQSPAAGASIRRSDPITLTVGKASC